MMNMNMGINIGMNNLNQVYVQMNQLMIQIMNNINIIVTNMNQLMSNMNQMNKLINEIGNNQKNNNNNNINNFNNMNNMINFNPMNFNNQNKYDFTIIFQFKDKTTYTQCNSKDKLSDVIKKYELETNTIGKKKYYIYNGKPLPVNNDVTVENSGILHCGRVLVIDSEQLIGW